MGFEPTARINSSVVVHERPFCAQFEFEHLNQRVLVVEETEPKFQEVSCSFSLNLRDRPQALYIVEELLGLLDYPVRKL